MGDNSLTYILYTYVHCIKMYDVQKINWKLGLIVLGGTVGNNITRVNTSPTQAYNRTDCAYVKYTTHIVLVRKLVLSTSIKFIFKIIFLINCLQS